MKARKVLSLCLVACIVAAVTPSISATPDADPIRGTLIVAVPLQKGLLTCADKRLFNIEVGTYSDNNVKIRKVGHNVLFVATNTVGFYDRKNRKIVFDAFEVTANYTSRTPFSESREFWDGLKTEIRKKLLDYFAARKYSEWPETDTANNNLLFNLIFYSVDGGRSRSHTLQVFYEKKRTPVVSVTGPVSEDIRSPKLSGKGRDLIAYIARNRSLASDPAILKFDDARFDIQQTSIDDAVEFSRTLFRLTNTGVPKAQVSSTFDCALLSYQDGFRWIKGGSADSSSNARMTPSIR
jgi:hypothetical protein